MLVRLRHCSHYSSATIMMPRSVTCTRAFWPTVKPAACNQSPLKRKNDPTSVLMAQNAAQPAAPAPAGGEGAATAGDKLSQEQLDQLVAPIALYPDDLLSQVFMASTYPLEIVQADRWVKAHKDLKGDALDKALAEQSWDASVKSLVQFPDVLSMMSEKLDITSKLGDAFIAQQKDVMDAVQRLRAKAKDAGNLQSNQQQTVIINQAPAGAATPQTIVIQPAQPEVVYVPQYNPTVVYGAWPYPAYPPYPYCGNSQRRREPQGRSMSRMALHRPSPVRHRSRASTPSLRVRGPARCGPRELRSVLRTWQWRAAGTSLPSQFRSFRPRSEFFRRARCRC